MRLYLILFSIALFPVTSAAFAADSVTAQAGKFTVVLSSNPAPPVVGQNILVITVKDGGKPLSGAGVDVHLDMTTMSMPADVQAVPGAKEGEYGASVNLSMAGAWKVDVAVQQMAGMKMEGDGTAHFLVETGKGITAKGGAAIPWSLVFATVLILAVIGAVVFRNRIPHRGRGIVAGVLTLLVVLMGTVSVVKKYRDPTTATVIGSALMDMDAMQAAPGTVAVATETVSLGMFQPSATYTGTVVPDIEEDIYPRVTGRLVYLPLYPGDHVVPGQVVARLDTTELAAKEAQAAYGSLGASQDVTAANADVAATLAAQARASKAVDQAQAQLAQARAAAKGADEAVKAAQSELVGTRQMAQEAESAVQAAQAGVDQANEAVIQAQSDVDSAQADVTYWTAEIAREKKLQEVGAISKEELDRETAQAATVTARLNQARAGVRTAQAGVNRANQELAQAQARQAAAQAAIATADARLGQALADRDASSGKIVEVQAGVETALADVRAAEASITGASAKAGAARASAMQAKAAQTEASTVKGYTEIRASTGGMVTARIISPGVLVQPGMSILKIAKIDYVRLQVNVSEADLPMVQVGQLMTAHTVDAFSQPIVGRVTAIFPVRDTTARTSIVEARIPNAGYQLKPGQYLTVEINLGGAQQQVITVPNSALVARGGQASVFVVVNDGLRSTAKQLSVTAGRVGNDRTEILAGLKEGDEVITSGQVNLHDGDAVTVVSQVTPATSARTS